VATNTAPSHPLPARQRVVVVGAGIVGNSVAYHLTQLGETEITLLDKGPLPNPGGSTGHASNFIFPVDHSKEMTALTKESMRQYKHLDVYLECGGIEVARTEERMQELNRRMVSAKTWGIEPVSLVTPAEIKELVPFINEELLLGGFYTPGAGVVDSLRAATIMRERAVEAGMTLAANTEVLGLDVEHGQIRRVRTTKGDIEADRVVIACGCWSPRIARMAGANIPLTPAVHQMIDIGPVPRFADAKTLVDYPIVRDMDTNMYERQDGGGLEIGSYAHRPILMDSDEIPSIEESALSPTELPFTQADFELQLEQALELMPELVGDETVGQRYAINGLSAKETQSYVQHHLALAGRSDTLFSDDAVALIHDTSRGLPRLINNLAVASLIAAFSGKRRTTGMKKGMKESYIKTQANRDGPESCVGVP